MTPPFLLNVDLEIESKSPLRPLAREWGDKVIVLYSGRIKGRHFLALELPIWDRRIGPERRINAFCELIEGLSPAGMQVWKATQKKTFDLGFEARLSKKLGNNFKLRPGPLRRLANLGASLAVTFYREDLDPVRNSDDGKKRLMRPKRKQK